MKRPPSPQHPIVKPKPLTSPKTPKFQTELIVNPTPSATPHIKEPVK